jgi:hypothetical protein
MYYLCVLELVLPFTVDWIMYYRPLLNYIIMT